jgi:hypothetical protein
LHVLKRSRTPPAAGDVFVVRPVGHDYYFGRVIDPKLKMPGFVGVLIYTYDLHAPDKSMPDRFPDVPAGFLIPPEIVPVYYWTTGVLETIGNQKVTKGERLPRHRFWDVAYEHFVDERGDAFPPEAAAKPEDCGGYDLLLPLGYGKRVSKALGIPFRD